jgi:hypothetical protein
MQQLPGPALRLVRPIGFYRAYRVLPDAALVKSIADFAPGDLVPLAGLAPSAGLAPPAGAGFGGETLFSVIFVMFHSLNKFQ